MPTIFHRGEFISGTPFDDTIVADFAAADEIFRKHDILSNVYYVWNRIVSGRDGDDLIIRDRPGDYVANGLINPNDPDEDEVELTGNVLVSGGAGEDTISYASFSGGMEIDLAPVAHNTSLEPFFWNGYADVSGTAKALGLNGETIHGFDYLKSIENADGTQFGDKISGSDGDNKLNGLGGNDSIFGRGGDDHIKGGDGKDFVRGGTGNDALEGGSGNDTVYGEDGHDGLVGGDGNDKLDGGTGNDTLAGNRGRDTLEGGEGNDVLYGMEDNDSIYGGDGYDTVFGGSGNDLIEGNDGDDLLYGGAGRNVIDGGDGDDEIHMGGNGGRAYGGLGSDTVTGSRGKDLIDVRDDIQSAEDNDLVLAGSGNDTIRADFGDTVNGGTGADRLDLDFEFHDWGVEIATNNDGSGYFEQISGGNSGVSSLILSIEQVKTGDNDDVILMNDSSANWVSTNDGDDYIWTAGGNDRINAGRGNDTIDAGEGNDYVRAGTGNDLVDAGAGKDNIRGHRGNDRIDAGDGIDRVRGGAGNDTILGGDDADVLSGGTGADGFVFREGETGVDRITDFKIGVDYIGIQDFLADPVPLGGSYVGKVFALSTHDGQATVLTGLTDDGWQSFARLDGVNVNDAWIAIQDGSLFGSGSSGPGGYVPPSLTFEPNPSLFQFNLSTDDLVFA